MKFNLLLCSFLLAGAASAQNVGVGTTTPSEKLEVIGNIKADTAKLNNLKIATNAAIGKLLMSDASGNASWQSGSNLIKTNNGLNKANDSIGLGGRLNKNTDIRLAQNTLSVTDIGTVSNTIASSIPASSSVALSATPITQTFQSPINALVTSASLNITAVNGGTVTLELKNSEGLVMATNTRNFSIVTTGLTLFSVGGYIETNQVYTLSITGNANAFINYDPSSNPFPSGSSSLGASADLGFNVLGLTEEATLTVKNNKVGVGISIPSEKLEVDGNVKAAGAILNTFQLSNGAGVNKVLMADAVGTGAWASPRVLAGSIAAFGNLNGSVGASIPAATNSFEFFGPTVLVTVNGSQRIILNINAVLGKTAAGTNQFNLDMGYQQQPSGVVQFTGNYTTPQPNFTTNNRMLFGISGSVKLAAGTYRIGMVINSSVANYLNNNEYAMGYYMILND